MLVKDTFKFAQLYEGEVGIEIEMEGNGNLWLPNLLSYWKMEQDGSLRGTSAEYVLQVPIKRDVIDAALDQLKDNLRGFAIADSIRAGVHVHVNVTGLTLEQVLAFACTYYVLEIPLINWCGPNRVGNHFCLRAVDAEYIVDHIINTYSVARFKDFNTDMIRYAALNFKALPTYGSLEFRSLQTEPKFDNIRKWVDILLKIKDHSLRYEHPKDIINEFSEHTPRDWAKLVLGDKFDLIKDQDDLTDNLIQGMRIAQDISYFSYA